jgi:hypothetical protein
MSRAGQALWSLARWSVASCALLLACGAAWPVAAAKLDKDACTGLSSELAAISATGIKADMERGPGWGLANMPPERLRDVRRVLELEDQLEFRCGMRGISKPKDTPAPNVQPSPGIDADEGQTAAAKTSAPASAPPGSHGPANAVVTEKPGTPQAKPAVTDRALPTPTSAPAPPAPTNSAVVVPKAPPTSGAPAAMKSAPAVAAPAAVNAPPKHVTAITTPPAAVGTAPTAMARPAAVPVATPSPPPQVATAPVTAAPAVAPVIAPVAAPPTVPATNVPAQPKVPAITATTPAPPAHPNAGQPASVMAANPPVTAPSATGSPPVTKLGPLPSATAAVAPGALVTPAGRKKNPRRTPSSAYVPPNDVNPFSLPGMR